MHVERTFTVPRPIDEVFDYLSDFENTNEWDPGTIRTSRTGGDGGLGTTYSNRSRFAGREVELEYTMIAFDRPTEFRCRGRNKQSTATDWMRFREVDGGTEVHYRADFEFHGITKLLAPLVVPRKLPALADETVADIQKALASPKS